MKNTARKLLEAEMESDESLERENAQPRKIADISNFSPRERILAAALKLFVEQGYFNTNVPDLSRESKCSVGSIYHTFRNKEEVASALYKEGISAFRNALFNSLNNAKDAETVIKTLVKSFLEFSEKNHNLSRYMWLNRHTEFISGDVEPPTAIGFDRLGRRLAKAVKQSIRDKKILPLEATIIWSILFGIPAGYVRDWLDGYHTKRPSEVAQELSEACWRALKA